MSRDDWITTFIIIGLILAIFQLGGTTLIELPGGVKIAGQAGVVIILVVIFFVFYYRKKSKSE
jgi:uncharacterized membrane protein